MNVVGIVAEFNPFHDGHKYLIEQAKKKTNSEYAVIIMSGDFVQRGEPAIFDKYTRTKAALAGGTDIIFELPIRFSLSSAGDFALGAVSLLDSLGIVTHLCFGSECNDIELLQKAASNFLKETSEYKKSLNSYLQDGMSFANARGKAAGEIFGIPDQVLKEPNNILGIEYCKALMQIKSSICPVTIKRVGLGYNEYDLQNQNVFPSSTYLRSQLYHTDEKHMELEDLSQAMGHALLTASELSAVKDISLDLAGRIKHFLPTYNSLSDLVSNCRNKSLDTSRIRRALMQCLLDIKESPMKFPYIRLLGMKKDASHLLADIDGEKIVLISKLASDIRKLSLEDISLIEQDILASDMYRLLWCTKYHEKSLNEYQHTPIIID